MGFPDFSAVTAAEQALATSENNLETASGKNDQAQSNLQVVTKNSNDAVKAAQAQADEAAASLVAANGDTVAKAQALDQEIQKYLAGFNPPPPPNPPSA